MEGKIMKRQANFRNMAVACLIILVLGIPGLSNADDDFDISRFIIFGDSLSDAGNFYIETREIAPVPELVEGVLKPAPFRGIPAAPYEFRGKFRFTNGPTWIEQLARELDIKRSGKPALKKPLKFTNYAFGRARARLDASPFFSDFNLSDQRTRFLTDFGWVAPADATKPYSSI